MLNYNINVSVFRLNTKRKSSRSSGENVILELESILPMKQLESFVCSACSVNLVFCSTLGELRSQEQNNWETIVEANEWNCQILFLLSWKHVFP